MEKKKPKTNKSRKGIRAGCYAAAAALACIGVLHGINGAMAYMTAGEQEPNKFVIGKVDIEADEPNFPTDDFKDESGNPTPNNVPDDCEKLIPFQEVPKNPRIHSLSNTGNPAIVYFRVTVPMEKMTMILEDAGQTSIQGIMNDLFWMKTGAVDDKTKSMTNEHKMSLNDGWVEITGDNEYFTESADGKVWTRVADNRIDKGYVDSYGNTDQKWENCYYRFTDETTPLITDERKYGKVYIFGYNKAIDPGEWTTPVFDKVQNKKYGSDTIGPKETEDILIQEYAIQADNIFKDKTTTIDASGTLDKDTLTYIFNTYCNQEQPTANVQIDAAKNLNQSAAGGN